QKNYTLIHAGCLCWNNEGFILPAWSNTGKSSTVLSLLKKHSYLKFVSEDFSMTDGRYIYNYTIFPIEKQQAFLPLPFITRYKIKKDVPIKKKCEPKYLFLLKRSTERSIKKLDKKEALKNVMLSSLHGLGSVFFDSFLAAYSYAKANFNIFELLEKEKRIFRKLVNRVDCYEIKNPDKDFSPLIEKIIKF
ncbi:MAG: hypothetical protein B6U95_09130, partial [Thermofilum sp. ex4484_82]